MALFKGIGLFKIEEGKGSLKNWQHTKGHASGERSFINRSDHQNLGSDLITKEHNRNDRLLWQTKMPEKLQNLISFHKGRCTSARTPKIDQNQKRKWRPNCTCECKFNLPSMTLLKALYLHHLILITLVLTMI
jgi:hypothetical protein